MDFLLANRAPIVIAIEGQTYSLPRFARQDFVAWAAELDAARRTEATKGMTAGDRYKLLATFPIAPTQRHELSAHVFTPSGQERIIVACAKRAGVPGPLVERLLAEADEGDLELLACSLASLVELRPATAGGGDPKGGEPDPLASPATGSTG